MQQLLLFPTVFGHTVIEKNTDELKKNKNFLPSNNNFEFSGRFDRDQSDYHALDKFPRIKKLLTNEFKSFISDLGYTRNFKMSTSWFTVMNPGDEGHEHLHQNSFYSGIYYYDEYEEECGSIKFESPVTQLCKLYVTPNNYNEVNGHAAIVAPKKNLLIFFPSYIYHKVNRHTGTKPRYSVAFNFIPTSEFGSGDSSIDFS